MTGEPNTPFDIAEMRIVRSIKSLLDELDEMIAFASDNDQPEVQTLVCAERIKLDLVDFRLQLLRSWIKGRLASKLKVVSNNG